MKAGMASVLPTRNSYLQCKCKFYLLIGDISFFGIIPQVPTQISRYLGIPDFQAANRDLGILLHSWVDKINYHP